MNNNIYILEMEFETDGDFGWDIAPIGFEYNNYTYTFKEKFYTYDEVKAWGNKYIDVLISNIYGKDYIVNDIIDSLNKLKESIVNNNDYNSYIGGNYNIDITFKQIEDIFQIPIHKTLFNSLCLNRISIEDIEKCLWNLINEKQKYVTYKNNKGENNG